MAGYSDFFRTAVAQSAEDYDTGQTTRELRKAEAKAKYEHTKEERRKQKLLEEIAQQKAEAELCEQEAMRRERARLRGLEIKKAEKEQAREAQRRIAEGRAERMRQRQKQFGAQLNQVLASMPVSRARRCRKFGGKLGDVEALAKAKAKVEKCRAKRQSEAAFLSIPDSDCTNDMLELCDAPWPIVESREERRSKRNRRNVANTDPDGELLASLSASNLASTPCDLDSESSSDDLMQEVHCIAKSAESLPEDANDSTWKLESRSGFIALAGEDDDEESKRKDSESTDVPIQAPFTGWQESKSQGKDPPLGKFDRLNAGHMAIVPVFTQNPDADRDFSNLQIVRRGGTDLADLVSSAERLKVRERLIDIFGGDETAELLGEQVESALFVAMQDASWEIDPDGLDHLKRPNTSKEAWLDSIDKLQNELLPRKKYYWQARSLLHNLRGAAGAEFRESVRFGMVPVTTLGTLPAEDMATTSQKEDRAHIRHTAMQETESEWDLKHDKSSINGLFSCTNCGGNRTWFHEFKSALSAGKPLALFVQCREPECQQKQASQRMRYDNDPS